MQSQSHTHLLERQRISKSHSQGLLLQAKLMLSALHLVVMERCSPANPKDRAKNGVHQCTLPQERDARKFSVSSRNPNAIHRALKQKLK